MKRELAMLALVLCMCAVSVQGGAVNTASRFEVDVFTQGDSIWDGKRYLERETPTVKAFRSIQVRYRGARPVSEEPVFICPPWRGQVGIELKWGMEESGNGSYARAAFVTSSNGAAAQPAAGRYEVRLADGTVSAIALTEAQEYLDYPHIRSVTGNRTSGYAIEWLPVPRAVGYFVYTYLGDGTPWRSSALDWRDLGVGEAVREGELLRQTACVVPGNASLHESFRVAVEAVGPDVRTAGLVPAVGFVHSQMTVEVKVK